MDRILIAVFSNTFPGDECAAFVLHMQDSMMSVGSGVGVRKSSLPVRSLRLPASFMQTLNYQFIVIWVSRRTEIAYKKLYE